MRTIARARAAFAALSSSDMMPTLLALLDYGGQMIVNGNVNGVVER